MTEIERIAMMATVILAGIYASGNSSIASPDEAIADAEYIWKKVWEKVHTTKP